VLPFAVPEKSPMLSALALTQEPFPGQHLRRFRGDTIIFTLTLAAPVHGTAWLRTNLGHIAVTRNEIFNDVERDQTPLARDWFDIPMKAIDPATFRVTLPLGEVGHFEAKCFFLPEGQFQPIWPDGPNTAVNVGSADTCCANIIYNAFVRQFGPNKAARIAPPVDGGAIQALDQSGYTVIPPSGTFRNLIAELDFIIGELGCRIIQLLPIHPTPTTYGRMGRFGSPYAALSFTAVDPALAVFDPKATPLEQFIELVDAVHARNGKLIIDIAINHTGWAASLHEAHPEWLVRGEGGRIEVPGAWGVWWEDLTRLDYSHRDLWRYMADVLLTWCRRGVDGFRCDAGYMVPVKAWRYIIAAVRAQFADTIFLLEGLGGKISVTRDLLNSANFDWTYSELFQNYDRGQIEAYLPEAIHIAATDGLTVHFAETHDNNRLAARSEGWARMRTSLCALLSPAGAFGFANGVEWLAAEKIDVHDACSLNWGADRNMVPLVQTLTRLLKNHPAFHHPATIELIEQGQGNQIVALRRHPRRGKTVVVVVNLDDEKPVTASWDPLHTGIESETWMDLLSGAKVTTTRSGALATIALSPAQVLCLSPDPEDVALIQPVGRYRLPQRVAVQRLRAKALDVYRWYRGVVDMGAVNLDQAAGELEADPLAFCWRIGGRAEPMVICWQYPADQHRHIMLPPGHFLLVLAPRPFRATIVENDKVLAMEESLGAKQAHFALFVPLNGPGGFGDLKINLSVYESRTTCTHAQGHLLTLPRPGSLRITKVFDRQEILSTPRLLLGTNGRGAMMRAAVAWGQLHSRYDALLAANLNPHHPQDRWIMFTRCRGWIVFQGFSAEINLDALDHFAVDGGGRGFWRYQIPTGQGQHIQLSIAMEMARGQNHVNIVFQRHKAAGRADRLMDDRKVQLILRPDIEDRSFHDATKAFSGPEHHWPASVVGREDGFDFAPHERRRLSLRITSGRFTVEPEWHYMVYRELDAQRGHDPHSDLFSPGYFRSSLAGGQSVTLWARVDGDMPVAAPDDVAAVQAIGAQAVSRKRFKPLEALQRGLDHYVAVRGDLKTVIAGYPWFLDWGRDSLIVARGLIADGRLDDARAILQQFGRFERQGTLPNMIVGGDAGNRDTSDAPLWFFRVCDELMAQQGSDGLLDESFGGRRLRHVLLSMGKALMAGTPNGVGMDPRSALIFSPAHFTWMDTNFPAATPRQGYPIDIQALWIAALGLLSRIDPQGPWAALARQAGQSILTLYRLEQWGYLADCLHAEPGMGAHQAAPDDALRPNQLFAITLGAVAQQEAARKIVNACSALLVPGAMRSLADRPLQRPLEIRHNGILLGDPFHAYRGIYSGDEDTSRKPAYHNGTAWTWLLPTFCEAWVMAYGPGARATAMAWLASGLRLMEIGCIGHIPEIMDGNYPHNPRGCDAQAWGISELLRVWRLLARQRV
jgi:predicted glycogen debranching enzyme